MKLCIISNFGPPHCGGSEEVIKNISQCLVNCYDYDVTIFAKNYNKPSFWEGIRLKPCPKGNALISELNNFDHIFVYSDSFWEIEAILNNLDRIKSKISLALVGAYFLQKNPKYLEILKNNIDKFNLITHSSITPDYKWCIDNDLPVTVIPNGVNLSEFQNNTINFREKYSIKEKYIILSVGNFFYGKGFELLPEIAKRFKNKDVIIISISNTIKYPYDLTFLNKTKRQSKGLNVRFFRDLPREDVVSAFNASDILFLPSKKEVAPLVLLEARASKTQWISMRVGNAEEVPGGHATMSPKEDDKGYKIMDKLLIDWLAISICEPLENNKIKKRRVSLGQQDIQKIDWKNIVPEYDRVFKI